MKGIEKLGLGLFLIGLIVFLIIPFLGTYTLSEDLVRATTKDIHQEKMAEILEPMYGQEFGSSFSFLAAFGENFGTYNDQLKSQQLWDQVIWDDYSFDLAFSALQSPVRENPWLYFGHSSGVLFGILSHSFLAFRKWNNKCPCARL